MLVLSARAAWAQLGEPVKPYIVFIVDVSGSMDTTTNSGPPSCGGEDTRFDHAKCAIDKITSSYGDMVLALARFRIDSTDTNCSNGCTLSYTDCSACNGSGGAACTPEMRSADQFQLLVPLIAENQDDILEWVNFVCGTCTTNQAGYPELIAATWTPLAGSLTGAKRYYQGNDPDWSALPGGDPIRDDPLKSFFPIPGGPQCRPYIVVLLTDGAETCAGPADTLTAAASLLTTSVDGTNYRIETKPIGFGMTCPVSGTGAIEDIAHAGGAANGAGCEGYYASNETQLSAAMAKIIQDALKFELCNDLDDDCDTLIDEDFPLKGETCDDGELGECLDQGAYICNATLDGVECYIDPAGTTSPGDLEEVCNGLDDDCDGEVDELPLDCSGCIGFEICDGQDNDCDGRIDEELTRVCGTDVGLCNPGTQECVELGVPAGSGTWEPCGGPGYVGPAPEECNGFDDDCNGVVDGMIRECTAMADPPGNPDVGICHPGIQVCPTDGTLWGPCLDEVVPEDDDPCDGLDNDCDGPLDEDFVPADCSTDCGLGATECVDGAIECSSSSTPVPESCNGFDDDCNTLVDDGELTDEPEDLDCYDGGLCLPGTLTCLGGNWVCIGGEPPGTEICDCEDNNCNDEIDEGDLCPPGAACVHCQCARPCAEDEFPCPLGRVCVDDYCIIDTCYQVTCLPDEDGSKTVCVDGECVLACDLVTCPPGFLCRGSDATCQPDNCTGFPDRCDEGQLCVGGVCVADPCYGVTCTTPQYCYQGDCVGSCAGVVCDPGEECVLGECVADPCYQVTCPGDQVCDPETGGCVDNPCIGKYCPPGEVCDSQTGDCITDPCLDIVCPGTGEICIGGSCYDPPQPDAGVTDHTYVAPGGGGGCAIDDGDGGDRPIGALLLLFLLVAIRRRDP